MFLRSLMFYWSFVCFSALSYVLLVFHVLSVFHVSPVFHVSSVFHMFLRSIHMFCLSIHVSPIFQIYDCYYCAVVGYSQHCVVGEVNCPVGCLFHGRGSRDHDLVEGVLFCVRIHCLFSSAIGLKVKGAKSSKWLVMMEKECSHIICVQLRSISSAKQSKWRLVMGKECSHNLC